MSVEVLELAGRAPGAVLSCNTSDWAFGPVFTSTDHAEDFLRWLRHVDRGSYGERWPRAVLPAVLDPRDARSYQDGDLERIYHLWRDDRLDEDGELRPAETVGAEG